MTVAASEELKRISRAVGVSIIYPARKPRHSFVARQCGNCLSTRIELAAVSSSLLQVAVVMAAASIASLANPCHGPGPVTAGPAVKLTQCKQLEIEGASAIHGSISRET